MVWIGSYVCGVRAELLNSAECSAAVLSVCASRDELVLVQVARDGTPSEDAARYRHRIGTARNTAKNGGQGSARRV